MERLYQGNQFEEKKKLRAKKLKKKDTLIFALDSILIRQEIFVNPDKL